MTPKNNPENPETRFFGVASFGVFDPENPEMSLDFRGSGSTSNAGAVSGNEFRHNPEF